MPFAQAEQQVAGGMVGEVAMVAADALLEVQRSLGEVEHLVVVIRFQDEDVRQRAMMPHHVGRMPEVRQPSHAARVVAVLAGAVHGIPDRVGGIVGDRNRGDLEPAEFERRACLEELPIGLHLQRSLDATGRLAVGEDL